MQAYFFDMFDGEKVIKDDYGDVFASISEAADQAAGLLADVVRETLPDSKRYDFGVAVRNDLGADVYRAALIFRETYPDPDCHGRSRQACVPLTIPDPTDLIRQSRETRAASRTISRQVKETADRLSDNLGRLAEALRRPQPVIPGWIEERVATPLPAGVAIS